MCTSFSRIFSLGLCRYKVILSNSPSRISEVHGVYINWNYHFTPSLRAIMYTNQSMEGSSVKITTRGVNCQFPWLKFQCAFVCYKNLKSEYVIFAHTVSAYFAVWVCHQGTHVREILWTPFSIFATLTCITIATTYMKRSRANSSIRVDYILLSHPVL